MRKHFTKEGWKEGERIIRQKGREDGKVGGLGGWEGWEVWESRRGATPSPPPPAPMRKFHQVPELLSALGGVGNRRTAESPPPQKKCIGLVLSHSPALFCVRACKPYMPNLIFFACSGLPASKIYKTKKTETIFAYWDFVYKASKFCRTPQPFEG
jgi:hypothetical protein